MLQVFGFHRIGVALADLYFVDPNPAPGQEGAERGVRLEVRLLDSQAQEGSIYAARRIVVDRPVWRVDLLESVEAGSGTFDRAHHHPRMRGWEPGRRHFDPAMSADPLGWLVGRLSDLDGLLEEAGIPTDEADPADGDELRGAAAEIVAAAERMLARVRAGELAQAPAGGPTDSVRQSWL